MSCSIFGTINIPLLVCNWSIEVETVITNYYLPPLFMKQLKLLDLSAL